MLKNDEVLDRLDCWKKRVIAAFSLLSLVVAVLIALIIEASAIKDVVNSKFLSEQARPDHTPTTTREIEKVK